MKLSCCELYKITCYSFLPLFPPLLFFTAFHLHLIKDPFVWELFIGEVVKMLQLVLESGKLSEFSSTASSILKPLFDELGGVDKTDTDEFKNLRWYFTFCFHFSTLHSMPCRIRTCFFLLHASYLFLVFCSM